MDSELVAVCAVQIMVLGIVVAAIVVYLLKHLMNRSRTDVTGKTIVITGCDSTLGFELARHYDKCGFRVFACCTRPSGEVAVRLQSEASTRLQIIELDVTSLNSLAGASKLIKDQLLPSEKGIWALINAATYCVWGELEWQTQKHCERQYLVNYMGVVNAVRTFLPLLKPVRGRIINIGMFAGERNNPEPGLAMYSGTKYAVEGLSEALRFELLRFGINVSVVQPDVSFLESCFLDEHHVKMNEMWNEMTAELRLANQDVFIAYHDRLAKSKSAELDVEEDTNTKIPESPMIPAYLRRCFDHALTSSSPSDVYVAVPSCASHMRINLFNCLPSVWREHMTQRKYKHNVANVLKV